jgi:hypothetical protein
MNHLLDNIFWHALTGPHARYAEGAGGARRYARGFSPILGFADAAHPDFAALAPCCDPAEHFYCGGWTGAAPAGWRIDAESTMFRMVRDAAAPAADETPFLHVMRDNDGAHRLYRRMGFRDDCETVVRVVSRC